MFQLPWRRDSFFTGSFPIGTEIGTVAPMKYKTSEEFHDHLLEAIEKKRSYHLKRFEEQKSEQDRGAVDALAWAYTLIKFGKGNIRKER
jgi:hypothetical protein